MSSKNAQRGLVLHRVELWNFGGLEHVAFEPKTTGVTVVYGPNEAGKSTIMAAVEQALSEFKADSKHRDVRRYFPNHVDAKPELEIDVEVGGSRARFFKSFQANKMELTVSGESVENLTGRPALDRFTELVNDHIDRTLFEALFVKQGDEYKAHDLAGIVEFTRALGEASEGSGESHHGAAEEGAAKTLLDLAAKEQDRYWGGRKRLTPKGEYKEAIQAAEVAAEQVEIARRDFAAAEQYIADVGRMSAELATLRQNRPGAEKELAEAEELLARAQKKAAELERFDQVRNLAQVSFTRAKDVWEQRNSLVAKVEAVRGQVVEATKAKEEAALEAQKYTDAEARVKEILQRAQAEAEVAYAIREAIGGAEQGGEWKYQVTKLEEAIQQAAALTEKKRELEDALAENPATDKAVDRVRKAHALWSEELRVRDSVATTVRVTSPEEATFDDDGQQRSTGEEPLEIKVTAAKTLKLGQFTVEIVPAHNLKEQDDRVADARTKLLAALRPLRLEMSSGCLAEAEGMAAARVELERTIQQVQGDIRQVTGGEDVAQLQKRVEELTRRGEEATRELEAAVARTVEALQALADAGGEVTGWREVVGLAGVGDPSGVREWLSGGAEEATTRTRKQDISAWVAEIDTEVRARRKERESYLGASALSVSTTAAATATALQGQLAALEVELNKARENADDDAVRHRMEQAESELAEAAVIAKEEKAKASDVPDVEDAQLQWEGAKTHLGALEREHNRLDKAIAETRAKLGAASTAADVLADAERQAAAAQRALAGVEHKAQAARMLWERLSAARDEAQQRYSAPYVAALNELTSMLLGDDVSLEVGQDFRVEFRVKDGLRLEKEKLSGGAKEQLEMIELLAMAELVGKGGGVPIFLDDVFGFTDTERLARFNRILAKLGTRHQIIVFTCNQERFSRIGGATLYSVDELKAV
ncbi:MAG TPA: AAA family ATPase [Candidatus Corynebacterium gallistercoris]|uniref:AAA family ATPase n=1 Tax=Candidatus Corynebacterium gallistercoris TaxID=2838530 RepID=A0A9D1UQD9_9CORY|nr:AAA family ATPase [Candidatus Corynebacterium gallistercoris]